MSTHAAPQGILVGVDGSPPSKVAVDWAAREAVSRNVPLRLVCVLSPPILTMWAEVPIPTDYLRWQKEQGEAVLAAAREVVEQAAKDSGGITVSTETQSGSAVPTLIDLSLDADMIVVGSHGRGALARGLLGSVSSGLVRHAHCPVAVIHDEDPLVDKPAEAPVLVGIDGSPASEYATEIAFDAASRRGVELVAVHAVSDVDLIEMPGVDYATLEERANLLLSERLAGWQERYPDVRIRRSVVWGSPAKVLVEQSQSAQLVVVGSHGRGGFAGMLLGSVSAGVAQAVRMPLIVARRT